VSLKLPVWKSKNNLLRENTCCTTKSLAIAKKICQELSVPYHVFDVQLDFKKTVVDYFICQLKESKTPNPCIVCNQQLKFQKLFEFAKKEGVKYIATGHYARIKKLKLSVINSKRQRQRIKATTFPFCPRIGLST